MRIYSIFRSVNGEVNPSGIGSVTSFVRFAGCSTSCKFCDTEYAKDPSSGTEMNTTQILDKLAELRCKRVTITGGEPFEQSDLHLLIHVLSDEGYAVTVETNGLHTFDKKRFPMYKANWVVDIKPESTIMRPYVLMNLDSTDFLKQVVGSEDEFKDACTRKNILQSSGVKATFAFSPEYGIVEPNELLNWIYKYGEFDAVMNVQLHKVLGIKEAN